MTSRHQKTSIKIAKDRLIRKVNEFNAVKLELIQSIEKSSKSVRNSIVPYNFSSFSPQ